MAYYKNLRSPWFERLAEAKRWMEEPEQNRRQAENIDRRNTKWRFEEHLMKEVKIIKDPQAPLRVGAGCLPDAVRNRKGMLSLDTYDEDLCIFRCIAVYQGAHRVRNTKTNS